MIKILFFIWLFGIIFTSMLYTGMLTGLKRIIISINSDFFPLLSPDVKVLFWIFLLGSIFQLYMHFKNQ